MLRLVPFLDLLQRFCIIRCVVARGAHDHPCVLLTNVLVQFFNALAGYLRKQPAWKMVLLLELVPLLCFLALRRGYSIVTQRTDPASWKETATSHPRNKGKNPRLVSLT